jgi:hypothetical protein
MSCLFIGLSSFVLHFGMTSTLTLSLGVVSFLFILYLTSHCAPLDNYFPPFSYALLLILTFLAYLSNILLLSSSRSIPYLTSSQQLLGSYSMDPYFFSSFPTFSKSHPLALGGLINHSIGLHAHHPSLYEQHLDPKWNLF